MFGDCVKFLKIYMVNMVVSQLQPGVKTSNLTTYDTSLTRKEKLL